MIGAAILRGSTHLPLRNHAASLASRAGPKDYRGQLQQIWDDFVTRWRYVRDPRYTETVVTTGDAMIGLVLGASAPPGAHGYGDCDDCAATTGAMLTAIGFPVIIKTIAPPGVRGIFSHVYVLTTPPGSAEWIPFDPVAHPAHGLGWEPPAQRWATWTLDGRMIASGGNFTGAHASTLRAMLHGIEGDGPHNVLEGVPMYGATTEDLFRDYGLENVGLAGDDPQGLLAWDEYGVLGFGAYAGTMGIINDPGILMEFDEADHVQGPGGVPMVRTKMLELSPTDYKQMAATGRPRHGCAALGDDGSVYQYQDSNYTGLGFSFFKKIFGLGKSLVKGVMKIGGKIISGAKALIAKLPGGKYLVKLYDKVHGIAMKLVRPLTALVGKYAAKLAPIAALIPGYGTAIAAALYTAGTVAQIMNKYGVTRDKKGKPKYKSGAQAKKFQAALHTAAKHAKTTGLHKKFLAAKDLKKQGKTVPPFAVVAAQHYQQHGAPPDVSTPSAETIARAIAFYMKGGVAPVTPTEPGAGPPPMGRPVFGPMMRRPFFQRQQQQPGAPAVAAPPAGPPAKVKPPVGTMRGYEDDRLLRAGTPEHVAALRGLGFEIPEA